LIHKILLLKKINGMTYIIQN